MACAGKPSFNAARRRRQSGRYLSIIVTNRLVMMANTKVREFMREYQAGTSTRTKAANRSASVAERSYGMFATLTTCPARMGKALL